MKTIMENWKKYQEDILTEAVQEPESKYDPGAEEEESDVSWTGSASSSTGTPQTTTSDPKGGGTGPGGAPAPPAKKAALHPRLAGHGERYKWKPGQQVDLTKIDPQDEKQLRRAARWNKAHGFKSGKTQAMRQPAEAEAATPAQQAVKPQQQAVKPQEKAKRVASQELQPKWIAPDSKASRAQKRANVAAGYSPSGHRAKAGLKRLRPRRKEVSEGLSVSQLRLTELIKQELKEIMDLPSDLSTPAGEAELRMDALSSSWEKLITDRILDGETGIWSNTDVVDPVDGERRALDDFLSILGNYVVSDEVDEGGATDLVKSIANQISDNLVEPNPHEWGIPLPKWENMPGFEPQDELQEGGRAGHIEPEDVILKSLQKVVEAWAPETPEGQKYEADILGLLDRFEEPLRLSAPTDRDVRRLRHGVKTGEWRQKKPWEK